MDEAMARRAHQRALDDVERLRRAQHMTASLLSAVVATAPSATGLAIGFGVLLLLL